MEHAKRSKPSIKIFLTKEEELKIARGPLSSTGGKGKASWLHHLVTKELDRYETLTTNRTQVDMTYFQKGEQP